MSLKKFIDQTDLETLLSEVRRKVEWDLGGDGIPRPHSCVPCVVSARPDRTGQLSSPGPSDSVEPSFLPHMLPSTPAQEAQLLTSLHLSPPYSTSIPSNSPLRALLAETTAAIASVDFGIALDGSLACAFSALAEHLLLKGLLGGEVVVGSDAVLAGGDSGGGGGEQPRGKGKRLAEILVEVSRWGRDCLTADQGGLSRNDIVDVSFGPPSGKVKVVGRRADNSPTFPFCLNRPPSDRRQSLADLPAHGAFSATIYSAYDDLLENDFF